MILCIFGSFWLVFFLVHFPLDQELDGLDPPDLPAIIPARSKPVLHAMKSLGQHAVFLFSESLASPKTMETVI